MKLSKKILACFVEIGQALSPKVNWAIYPLNPVYSIDLYGSLLTGQQVDSMKA